MSLLVDTSNIYSFMLEDPDYCRALCEQALDTENPKPLPDAVFAKLFEGVAKPSTSELMIKAVRAVDAKTEFDPSVTGKMRMEVAKVIHITHSHDSLHGGWSKMECKEALYAAQDDTYEATTRFLGLWQDTRKAAGRSDNPAEFFDTVDGFRQHKAELPVDPTMQARYAAAVNPF
ncbi:MAG: hypothetical protein SP1CHLAM54_09310 [Chlamydiia bacterium]|nr:hypothetical protein [Chlamydiia bacterium]MCH9615837.1 hypothetical protein [Chlamydiia bacterium]MCH9628760.1 hypothetical protein [Chlamydiia bacterium]